MWEYVKGSEADFAGFDDEQHYVWLVSNFSSNEIFATKTNAHFSKLENFKLIAERRKVDNLQTRVNDANWEQAFDTVQRPAHYNQSGIECIDAIAAAVKGKSGIEASLVGNVIKYLWRYELKNGVEDVQKAQWYLERLVKELSK